MLAEKSFVQLVHTLNLSNRLFVVGLAHYDYMKNLCDVVGGLMPVPRSGPEVAVLHDDFADAMEQLHTGACRKEEYP